MMRSVERTLAVFDSFTVDRPTLTLQEIARKIGLPKSTTFRIVQSLEKAAYLVRLENQEYSLSHRFTRLAGLVKSTLDIRQVARPIMIALAKQVEETVTLNTVIGLDRVCLDVVETTSVLRSYTQAGQHVRLVDGASAKVLMAHMPKKQLDAALKHAARVAKKTRAQYVEELARIRENGYAITHGERAVGLTAVSVPISDGSEDVHYCLTIAGPTARMEPVVDSYLKALLRAGAEISHRLGAATAITREPRSTIRNRY